MDHQELKALRESMGLTQKKAALLLGVTERGYIKREVGEAPIKPESIYALRYLSEHPEEVRARLAAPGPYPEKA